MMMTPKMQMFCAEYLVDLNAAAAARRAGYSERYANRQANQLLAREEVRSEIERLMADRSKRTGITADYVLNGIRDVAERSVAEESYDASAALRAFELLGKHLKLFTDKSEQTVLGPDGGAVQHEVRVTFVRPKNGD